MSTLSEQNKELHQHCLNIAENRIASLKAALHETQNSANNETKSSAGDKHETGRAMAQLETEKLTNQLSEALKLKETLEKIGSLSSSNNLGKIVITNKGTFYLAVSLGKVEIHNQPIFVISSVSPIGKLLLTKKEKESFSFNGNTYVITKIA